MPDQSTPKRPAPFTCPRCKEWSEENISGYCPTCIKIVQHEHYVRKQEQRRAAAHRRYHANPERHKEYSQRKREKAKRAVIDAYGGKCECCGEWRIEFLAIHHRNGNGKKHRIESSGVGSQFYRWLARQGYPDKDALGVLCHNCNMSHGFYGYCPHQREKETTSDAARLVQLTLTITSR